MFKIKLLNISAAGEDLNSSMKFDPFSADKARLGSIGTAPRNGTFEWAASFSPFPLVKPSNMDKLSHKMYLYFFIYTYLEKMLVHSLQLGQTNPLMFSMIPIILRFALRQNVISRRTSPTATACGVVTEKKDNPNLIEDVS